MSSTPEQRTSHIVSAFAGALALLARGPETRVKVFTSAGGVRREISRTVPEWLGRDFEPGEDPRSAVAAAVWEWLRPHLLDTIGAGVEVSIRVEWAED